MNEPEAPAPDVSEPETVPPVETKEEIITQPFRNSRKPWVKFLRRKKLIKNIKDSLENIKNKTKSDEGLNFHRFFAFMDNYESDSFMRKSADLMCVQFHLHYLSK